MTNPADSKTHPVWSFNYFYDSQNDRELYKHAHGQGDEVRQRRGPKLRVKAASRSDLQEDR